MARKISNYLINQKMQLRITLKYLFIVLLSSILTGLLVYATIWPLVTAYVPYTLVNQLQTQILVRLSGYSILLIPLLIISCVILTHRIAGPIYNMEQKLDKLIQGEDVDLIMTRKGDEFKDLVEKLNELILMLRSCK